MKILAIDPGTFKSAFITEESDKFIFGIEDNSDILEYVKSLDFDCLAIEMIACYGMAVGKETFDTCVWIGRLLQVARHKNKKVLLVPRLQIKIHLCHSARAKDQNIRQSLIDRWGGAGKKSAPGKTYGISSHVWAALGVYTYAFDNLKDNHSFEIYDNPYVSV